MTRWRSRSAQFFRSRPLAQRSSERLRFGGRLGIELVLQAFGEFIVRAERGRAVAAIIEEPQEPTQRDLVVGVDEQAEVGQRVADLSPLAGGD